MARLDSAAAKTLLNEHNVEVSPTPTIRCDTAGEYTVDFDDNDPRDPANFSYRRKWMITLDACLFTALVGAAASSFSMGYDSMIVDLNCSQFEATVGLSLYALGFGLVPLVTSSFSEEFGRQPLYVVCSFVFMLTQIMIALSQNIQTVIIARALGGAFGSTGATLVGGSIADIWRPHERGLPMALFAFMAVAMTGLGPAIAGWISANPHLQWRWIQWISAMFTGVYFISVLAVMRETRSSIILSRIAQQLRKETGDNRYRSRAETERLSLLMLIKMSCTRPIYLLMTEPTVQCFSLWIGFTWGVVFCLVESVSPEFQSVYHFGLGETGSVFVTLIVGSCIGFCLNIFQEKLYAKYYPVKKQEARLYLPCVAALLFPIGMFIYAWTASSNTPWIVPVIGLTIFMTGAFVVYLVVFLYLADCYGTWASSALAGQSLCRNLANFAFPLFTQQMYARLTYHWASTLLACLSLLMIPIPYALFFYGSAIRRRSKVSRKLLEADEANVKRDNAREEKPQQV